MHLYAALRREMCLEGRYISSVDTQRRSAAYRPFHAAQRRDVIYRYRNVTKNQNAHRPILKHRKHSKKYGK
jgi:hypothetical protein